MKLTSDNAINGQAFKRQCHQSFIKRIQLHKIGLSYGNKIVFKFSLSNYCGFIHDSESNNEKKLDPNII